jgi:hypothetical protein
VKDRTSEADSTVIAFRAPDSLVAELDTVAALEGISRADVARRACIRDLRVNRPAEAGGNRA